MPVIIDAHIDPVLRESIMCILDEIRFNRECKGYTYLVRAIELVATGQERIRYISKALYVTLADEYCTTTACIERNIRYVIEATWNKAERREILHFLNLLSKNHSEYTFVMNKPSNAKFIRAVADAVSSNRIIS